MALKLGSTQIASLYLGSTRIHEAYVGNVKVFGTAPSPSTVTIGGRSYPYVQIGNQLWIAENLDWKWSSLTYRDGVNGNDWDNTWTSGQGSYFDYDESTYGENGNKYGMLYDWYAVNQLVNPSGSGYPTLPTGWHVPTTQEWNTMINYIDSTGVDPSTALKSSTAWNGTDNYGFDALPSGWRWNSTFYNNGTQAYYWTATPYTDTKSYTVNLVQSTTIYENDYLNIAGCSLRLCYNLT